MRIYKTLNLLYFGWHYTITTIMPPSHLFHRATTLLLFKLGLAFIAVCGSGDALADEQDFLAELPVVVSASRMPQNILNSPASVTIIDRDMIAASGLIEIPELLRLVPGFQVARATGRNFLVTYHGQEITFPSRLEVLVDGRSVYGNLLANVNWNAIGVQIEDIERIEVIRGPNAPVFGANALIATINIETRQPYDQEGHWVALQGGSNDYGRSLLRYARATERLAYRVTAAYETGAGYDAVDTRPDYDSFHLSNLAFRGNYSLDAQSQLDIQLGMTHGDPGTMHPGPELYMLNHEGGLNANYQLLRWTHTADDEHETYVQLTHNFTDQTDRFGLPPLSSLSGLSDAQLAALGLPPDQPLYYVYADGRSQRYDVEFQQRQPLQQHLRLAWGAGLRLDLLKSPALLGSTRNFENRSGRGFANVEWQPRDPLRVNLGMMLESNRYFDLFGSSRLALNYLVRPWLSLRSSASHTRRSPSLLDENWHYELTADNGQTIDSIVLSPGNLKTEKLTAYELGFTATYPKLHGHLDVKYFVERGYDLISYPRDTRIQDGLTQDGAEVISNDDRYVVRGAEGELRWQPTDGSLVALQYMRASSKSRQHRIVGEPAFRTRIATPDKLLSLLVSQRLPSKTQLSIAYYFSNAIKWLGDGDTIKPKDRIDLRIAHPLQAAPWNGQIEFIAQSIDGSEDEYVHENRADTRYLFKFELKAP